MSVHSCGPNCTRPLCVANRRIVELEDSGFQYGIENTKLQIERDVLQAKVDMLTERCYPNSVVMIGDTGHYVNDAVKARIEELQAKVEELTAERRPINILMTEPPSPTSQFVEVETDDGKSIKAGEWIKRPDGLWALRIIELPPLKEGE